MIIGTIDRFLSRGQDTNSATVIAPHTARSRSSLKSDEARASHLLRHRPLVRMRRRITRGAVVMLTRMAGPAPFNADVAIGRASCWTS